VPSHRDALRKRLEVNNLPPDHRRRNVATLGITAIIMVVALTAGYPSWAKDLWNTVTVKTISFQTKDGMKVMIRRTTDMGTNCCMPGDSQVQVIDMGGRKAIAIKKCLDVTAERSDSFSISTEAILKHMNLSGEGFKAITISTTDGEKTWIVNGDTIDAGALTQSIETVREGEDPILNQLCAPNTEGKQAESKFATTEDFTLDQNSPNPFNPTTQISFDLKQGGDVTLKVYNLMGQTIATLVNGYQNAGRHTVNFNASHLPSGTYMYTLQANGTQYSKMMTLAK
jgi:hypothetical protein